MRLKQVVLPAPLGPIRPMSSPRRSCSENPETAERPPNRLETSLARRSGSVSVKCRGTWSLAAPFAVIAILGGDSLAAETRPPTGGRALWPELNAAKESLRPAEHHDDEHERV